LGETTGKARIVAKNISLAFTTLSFSLRKVDFLLSLNPDDVLLACFDVRLACFIV